MSQSGAFGMKLNSVLVIGGAGLVGASFCHAVARAGYVPITYDNPKQGHETRVKWGPLVRGTVFDRDRLNAAVAEYKPDTIVYCPTVSRPEFAMSDPAIAYRTHLSGTLALLELARENSIEQFLYVSSAAIYGDAGNQPIREEQAPSPISPLGSSFMICERMIRDFASVHRLRFAILRSFSAAGADEDAHLPEDLENSLRLVPNLIAAAAGLRPQVTLNGSNFTTRDGTTIRDYIHVTDLAHALLLALRTVEIGAESRIYNIGTGTGTSALELAHIAERISERRIPIVYGPRRAGDPSTLISDSSLARVMLGWTPKQSAADQIIRSAWHEWLEERSSRMTDARTRVAS